MASIRALACVAVCGLASEVFAGGEVLGFYGLRNWMSATSVTDDGRVYVNGLSPDAMWSPTGVSVLNSGSDFGFVSANGEYLAVTDSNHAYRYRLSTGTRTILPAPPGGSNMQSTSISGAGNVIVGFHMDVTRAWRWTAGGTTAFLASGFSYSVANAVSFDGQVTVGRAGFQPFIERVGQPLQTTGPFESHQVTEFHRVSRDNQVYIGGAFSGGTNAFGPALRWTQSGGYETLGSIGTIPGATSQNYVATAMNANASLIAGTQGYHRAWIWDSSHGMRDLRSVLETEYGFDLSGWRLGTVRDVSADGTVLCGEGVYLNENGGNEYRAWVAVIPSPTSGVVGAIATIFAAARRRR